MAIKLYNLNRSMKGVIKKEREHNRLYLPWGIMDLLCKEFLAGIVCFGIPLKNQAPDLFHNYKKKEFFTYVLYINSTYNTLLYQSVLLTSNGSSQL